MYFKINQNVDAKIKALQNLVSILITLIEAGRHLPPTI